MSASIREGLRFLLFIVIWGVSGPLIDHLIADKTVAMIIFGNIATFAGWFFL